MFYDGFVKPLLAQLILMSQARRIIAMLSQDFIFDGCTILVHGFSRVVLEVLKTAAQNNKLFRVLCTGLIFSTPSFCIGLSFNGIKPKLAPFLLAELVIWHLVYLVLEPLLLFNSLGCN